MVDAEFSKQRIHAEGSRFVGNDGDDALTEGLVLHQRTEHPNKRHGGGNFHLPFGSGVKFGVGLGDGKVDRLGGHHAFRHWAAHGRTTLGGVSHQFRDVFRHHVGVGLKVLVGEGKTEVGAHELHRVHVGFFLLVGGVASCKRRSEAVAFDGSNKNDGRLTFVRRGLGVGGVEFGKVVAADVGAKGFEVVVGQMSNERRKSIRVEQFFANGCAVGGHDALLVAVHQPVEPGGEETLRVPCEQVVPRTAPEHLDDVPPRTSEAAFELLNDF